MKHEAIRNLYPSVVTIDDTAGCFDESGNLVTVNESDIQTEIQRLESIQADNAYQIDRRLNYPSIANQLDMLWHAIDSGTLNKTSDFYTTIKAVKDAYPKSE